MLAAGPLVRRGGPRKSGDVDVRSWSGHEAQEQETAATDDEQTDMLAALVEHFAKSLERFFQAVSFHTS